VISGFAAAGDLTTGFAGVAGVRGGALAAGLAGWGGDLRGATATDARCFAEAFEAGFFLPVAFPGGALAARRDGLAADFETTVGLRAGFAGAEAAFFFAADVVWPVRGRAGVGLPDAAAALVLRSEIADAADIFMHAEPLFPSKV
jgi:hypothetical protein